MIQYFPKTCTPLGVLLLLLFVAGIQAVKKFTFPVGTQISFSEPLVGTTNGVTCEFPNEDTEERATVAAYPYGKDKLLFKIKDAEVGDAGIVKCKTSQATTEFELVIYETSGIRDFNIQVLSGTEILVSWKAPLKSQELIQKYTLTAFTMPSNRAVVQGKLGEKSDSGVESHVIPGVFKGDYRIQIVPYYSYSERGSKGFPESTFLNADAWDGPELSLTASALTPDTVLVTLQTLDSENITGLELTYSDGTIDQNWTQIAMDENERFSFVRNLQPQTTYFIKAKGTLRLGPKEVVTHVKTPPSAIPPPSVVNAQPTLNDSVYVNWSQENSDDVKAYKITVEKQQADQSYSIDSEIITSSPGFYVNTLSQDSQNRITVSAIDLNGLGRPSEPVFYPEIPEATTETPVTCPTAIVPDDEPEVMVEPIATFIELDLKVVKQTASRYRVTWFVQFGDIGSIDKFQILVTSSSGKELIDSKLSKNQRSIVLHPMSSDTGYSVTVKALDNQGNSLGERSVAVTPKAPEGDPELLLEVNEIQNKQARLVWTLRNVEPSLLKEIRMNVLRDGPDGDQVVRRVVSSDTRSIVLSRLPYDSVFYITVDALGQDGKPFLSSALTLNSPASGEIGVPVTGAPKPISGS